MRRCWLAAIAALAACGGSSAEHPATGCFVGTPDQAPELVLVHQTADGALATVVDGAPIPLVQPPQGGEVLLVGVRARNIDGCPLTLSTSLAIPQSSVVAAFERRPVTLELASDGWLQPKRPDALSNFSNLPSCPIAGLARAVERESYELTIAVEDQAGRKAQVSATVVPSCDGNLTPSLCHCLCSADYVLGSACP
jgi:hypothetical protein